MQDGAGTKVVVNAATGADKGMTGNFNKAVVAAVKSILAYSLKNV